MSTKVIEWLFSKIISLLHTCVVTTTSGRSEVSEDQCAGHHWQLREDGCWWGFERCLCYLSDWLSDWLPQGVERSWGGGGALIVMRDRGEVLKANQSHWLRVVGGAGASLEDDTSHFRRTHTHTQSPYVMCFSWYTYQLSLLGRHELTFLSFVPLNPNRTPTFITCF